MRFSKISSKLKPRGRAKIWLILFFVFVVAFWAANFDYPKYWNETADWTNEKLENYSLPGFLNNISMPKMEDRGYSLGLDLQGGVHLVYRANLDNIAREDQADAMASLRDAIERRVNFLGVSEPIVQVQQGSDAQRLIVELAGIDDPATAIEQIGQTPFLEFKELRLAQQQETMLTAFLVQFPDFAEQLGLTSENTSTYCQSASFGFIGLIESLTGENPCLASTGLTGQFLDRAGVASDPNTGQLQISLQFNKEGAELFSQITARNIGQIVAIYLDGAPVSTPVVNQEITGGQAVITGDFTLIEARELANNLNAGALPVPIELISQQRVGASLGEQSLQDSLRAGLIGAITVLILLMLIYRFSGLMAALSLLIYLILLLFLIKSIPVTLTLAGIAGIILSVGMAVDANVLVFERLKEEIVEDTENIERAIDKAFIRAWPSIRDGNISTLLTAAILFWFSTSFVQGFALTLGLGILVSMFSAMVVTKFLLKGFAGSRLSRIKWIWTR